MTEVPMIRALSDLGVTLPVLAAPMAGGPGGPALVVAAARAGALGFVAGGYRTPQSLADQIAEVRAQGVAFGVNLFAPNPVPVAVESYRRYAAILQPEADRYGLTLAGQEPVEDDDHWHDKIDLLLAEPVPVLGFTFGVPDRAVVTAVRKAGTTVVQTVTSPAEADLAVQAGADVVIVQASAAGGHSATLTPDVLPPATPLPDLVTQVRHAVGVPLIAAGGLATAPEVAAALRAGADVAMVGTALLRTDESGASATHQAALADPARDRTVVTRAFTGRPARALRNGFIDRFDDLAPTGYPALHHLTRPLRAAAAAAGDAESVHLWAGTGYRHAKAEPAARTLGRLAAQL